MTIQLGETVGHFHFVRPDGTVLSLSDYRGTSVLLIFLRHLACIACRGHLVEVDKRYSDIKQLGGEVLVVSFGQSATLEAYLASTTFSFPVVSDPPLQAYRAFGLGRTTWQQILSLGVIWRYLKLTMRGEWPRRPSREEDLMQLGGDFVIDAEGRLVFAHRSSEPTDRPAVGKLVAAIRKAGQSRSTPP